ncbi:TIGR01457 family HAD-type hydrolase [Virgibacillus profundi]|uniref:Acid sugar phosphatase n=1 Tax=Virgibacillus profundi TaxID=2024555 RepID=A0A2A2IBI0_9BACI|nr:TIGR01457 family HAD-type hydrolase [Virgibacillus profundi]PAV28738.1 TIGR01457 family HAD-type hydrolase [Virgibacillus profundi]PXY52906.1 TIGR01457 family HAD-type hydrolase [Virgibacillus profundi]
MKNYKGYLIDLDGTMYRGSEPIEAAAEFVNALHTKNIPYLFVTNNSSKTQEDVSDKLNNMRIRSTPDHVVTTSLATARFIKHQKKDARCYVIGEAGLRAALKEQGLTIVEDTCDFVVVGIDREISYEKLAKGCIEIRNGATFISTNSDVAIPTERGLLPGNGALTSIITVSTGRAPIFIGKPEAIIMEEALGILGLPKNETLMVGDNYHTDIRAGINAGIDTLMVFTGVTPFAELANLEIKPDYHVQSLREWIGEI